MIAIGLCAGLVCNQGCKSTKKEADFSLLTQPIAYRHDDPQDAKPDGVLGKTKAALKTTAAVAGAGVLLVGFLAFKVLLHNDDDDDDQSKTCHSARLQTDG